MAERVSPESGMYPGGRPRFFRLRAVVLALILAGCAPAREPRIEPLYQGQAIVTGQDERSRPRGIVEAFEDVLVKVSGDPRLIGDPRVAPLSAHAASAVTAFSYRDRMEGIPIHDEQGTRDRPYDLTVRFEPERIDDALRALGRTPWLAPRPILGVFVGIQIGAFSYVLASDGERGFDQRNALRDAAVRRGMPVAIPSRAELAAANLRFETMTTLDLADLEARAKVIGGECALTGRMIWDQANPGWTARWRFRARGREYDWEARDTTFDESFRRAIGSAAQILSGSR